MFHHNIDMNIGICERSVCFVRSCEADHQKVIFIFYLLYQFIVGIELIFQLCVNCFKLFELELKGKSIFERK